MDSDKLKGASRSKWNDALYWLIVVFILLGGSVGYYAFIEWWFDEPSSAGTFGDMFGLFGAYISGLAFAGVLFSLRRQKDQAQDQQDQINKQLEHLKHSQFEATYFRLLEFHQKIVNELEEKDIDSTGRNLLKHLFLEFEEWLSQSPEESKEEVFGRFIDQYSTPIGTYFRSLRYILKFLVDSESPDERTYSNMLRSQMSHEEVGLLYYNMCHRQIMKDDPDFKDHIRRLNLIKVLENSTQISSLNRDDINEFIKSSEEAENSL
jgi:hypothetical protein